MAYATTNPPQLMLQLHPAGVRLWVYVSADAAATVRVSGYFTNGVALGMKAFDQIWVIVNTTGVMTGHIVNVTGTTVDLSDATALNTATNSD